MLAGWKRPNRKLTNGILKSPISLVQFTNSYATFANRLYNSHVLEDKKIGHQKQAQILNAYLVGGMSLISEKLSDADVRAGVQVYILGMADLLRQAEKLSWPDFLAICQSVFEDHKLLPAIPIEDFIDHVSEVVSTNDDVAKMMKIGAQSIQMYVGERDAQATIDLLMVPQFVEETRSSFSQVASPGLTMSTAELLHEAAICRKDQRHKQAISCWMQAADRESAEAQYYLWLMYSEGHGGLDDYDVGLSYLKKAADQGYGQAELELAEHYAEELIGGVRYAEKAIYWGTCAFDHGFVEAATVVGNMYAVQRPGVDKDDAKAFSWFRKAAEAGDGYAQFQVGVSYEHGLGVEKDENKANHWYSQARISGYEAPEDRKTTALIDLAKAKALATDHLCVRGRALTTVEAQDLPSPGVYGFDPEGWATFCVVDEVPWRVGGDEFVAVNLTTGEVLLLGVIGD